MWLCLASWNRAGCLKMTCAGVGAASKPGTRVDGKWMPDYSGLTSNATLNRTTDALIRRSLWWTGEKTVP